jgi:O-antigen/teichoic acid export membrane protein
MRLRYRLGRGIAWNTLAAVSTNGANFLTALLLANILGKDAFGEFAIVQSTILSVAGIAQVATGLTATKFVAQYRDANKKQAGRVIGICALATAVTGLIGALLLLLGNHIIAASLLGAPEVEANIALAAGVVFFSTMNGFQVGALAGLEHYRGIAAVSLGSAILHFAVCVALALLGGIQGVITALIVSAASRWILYGWVLASEAKRQRIEVAIGALSAESRVLVTFAAPAALGGVSALLAIWLGNAFLVRQENGLGQMGLYAAANNLRALLLFFPALVNGVGVSVINNFAKPGHFLEYRAAFWANLWITCATLVAGATALAFAGSALLSLFGREFVGASLLLNVMIAGAVVEGIGIALYQIVQSRARMWLSLCLISLPRDFLFVALAWVLVPKHGALGLAISHGLALVAALLLVFLITMKLGLAPWANGVQRQELPSQAQ